MNIAVKIAETNLKCCAGSTNPMAKSNVKCAGRNRRRNCSAHLQQARLSRPVRTQPQGQTPVAAPAVVFPEQFNILAVGQNLKKAITNLLVAFFVSMKDSRNEQSIGYK
jgi:hypothetical protein